MRRATGISAAQMLASERLNIFIDEEERGRSRVWRCEQETKPDNLTLKTTSPEDSELKKRNLQDGRHELRGLITLVDV